MWHFSFAVFLSMCLICSSQRPDSLQFVHLLYRHGDRSPTRTYPLDPNQESAWPQGFGQLSNKGMLQAFKLGLWLRSRYSNFISTEYNREHIYVRSSDYDRTLMSAQCVLSGMYKPGESQQWNSQLPWQPIPIHTKPQYEDWLLLDPPCPVLESHNKNRTLSPEEVQLQTEYKGVMDLVNLHTGANLTSIFGMGYIQDALLCERRHDKDAGKNWNSDVIIKAWYDHIAPVHIYHGHKDELQRRLMGGAIVGQIIRDWRGMTENITDQPMLKMMMYSAHDSTVLKLLFALDAFNWRLVPYSTCVMVELHQTAQQGYFVQIWLKNDTETQPDVTKQTAIQLQIGGCEMNCSLPKFMHLMEPIVPSDRYRECHIGASPIDHDTADILVALFASLIVSSFIAFSIICCSIRKHQRKRPVRTFGKMRAEQMPEEMPMMLNTASDDDDDEL